MSQIFDCIYGASGTGKSECCARVIEQHFQRTGKKARVVLGDGSSLTYKHLEDVGVIEVCEFMEMPWPQDTMQKLSNGWWPDAKGELVPPGAPGNDLSTVGVYVFEGLSVAAYYIMSADVEGSLARRAALGEKIAQEAPYRIIEGVVDPKTGKVLSGPGTAYAANSMAHYGVTQKAMTNVITSSKKLPVDIVLWTAHEAQNNPENDLNKEPIIGPEVVGRAMTSTVQKHFFNTLHCCTVAKRTKQQDAFTGRAVDDLDLEYRLYTRDHFSASGTTMTRFKALTRQVNSNTFPQYLASESPGLTLVAFYEKLNEITKEKGAAVVALPQAAAAEELSVSRESTTNH
jgi:hypothetical protein